MTSPETGGEIWLGFPAGAETVSVVTETCLERSLGSEDDDSARPTCNIMQTAGQINRQTDRQT